MVASLRAAGANGSRRTVDWVEAKAGSMSF
jgi:hypothetical protein